MKKRASDTDAPARRLWMRLGMMGGTVLIVVCLDGCLHSTTIVNVNPDGSGTVDETVVVSRQVVAMLGESAPPSGQQALNGPTRKPFNLYNKNLLEQEARIMGPGVTLASSGPLKDKFGSGYHAVFAFPHIQTLRLSLLPREPLQPAPAGGGQGSGAAAASSPGGNLGGMSYLPGGGNPKSDAIAFHFEKGNPSVLRIDLPRQPRSTVGGPKAPVGAEEAAIMKQFLQGMHLRFLIRLNGTLVASNASFRKANTITLLDMSFSDLLANPGFMKALEANGGNFEALADRFPGLDLETKPVVTVRFR